MADKTGKPLEELVKMIEQFLLPEGFKVESREKIFDESGVQIAEFDLVVSGCLGSSTIRWLIECRDRPAGETEPGSWIEQLAGRKQRFNFDKAFAVSTSGFSKSARDCAERFGIILRTVKNINEIASDFKILGFQYNLQEFEFIGPMGGELEDPNQQINLEIRRPLIRRLGEMDFQPLPIFVPRNRQSPPAPDFGIELMYFQCEGWVEILAEQEIIRIKNIRVPLLIKHFGHFCKALFGRVYSENEKTIWAEATFEIDTPRGEVKTRMQVFKHPAGQMTAKIFNDARPDGYYFDSIRLYGLSEPDL